jgi:polysaccharide biosynthesis protein PslH
MKILQLCNKIPFPPKDGGTIAMYNLARGLSEEGNNIDILAMETLKHPAKKNIEGMHPGISLTHVFVDTTVKWNQLLLDFIWGKIPYIAKRFISAEYEAKLIEMLKENNYDVVQLEGLYLAPYIKTIRKHSKSKIALRSHNIENEIWNRLYINEKFNLKKIYFKNLAKRVLRFEKKIINQYDFLIPITYRDAAEYQKLGNTKPNKVIQTGIPSKEIAEKLTIRNDRKLYFLGSLDWLPNQEGLLWFVRNVWPMIWHSNTKLEFHIAGRNAPQWFEKAVDKQGITFHGEVESASQFVENYDIMIVPLLAGGGMRVKIVEAMALGKIVVTTPIGAEGLDIIPNYHAIVAETPEDFGTGVGILLQNTDFYTKLGNNSIRFIKNNYTNRALAKDLAAFFESNM